MRNRKTPLRQKSKSDLSQCKDRIQALLREIGLIRDGGCVLRYHPQAGECGGFRNDGELILQAEHLNTRAANVSYGDMRNIVILCKRHHFYFKQQYSRIYWDLIKKIIGPERSAWLDKVENDRGGHHMILYDWLKIEMFLTQELKNLKGDNSEVDVTVRVYN